MRTINNAHLNCPEGWDQKADDARTAVANGTKTVSGQSKIWQALKNALAECSCDKCWYCEIKQERSDDAVDHFRPKSLYPWLAFDKTNFRYACTYCNSQRKNPETGETEGKGDQFPLLDGTLRAEAAGQEAYESPVLLDPCRAQDPGFLDFYDDGRPCPKHKDHPVRKLRAETSIKLYHLDHPDLNERRRVLAADLKQSIRTADGLFDRCDAGDPAIDNAFHGLIVRLSDAMADKAELSTFARKVIAGFRDKVWIEELLNTA
ncbi:MAG: hypothetical protein M0P70_12675 [Desulfobulbaceae bacterium]|nr:hypothetical protein [Desulfobulbaceae bacterium]